MTNDAAQLAEQLVKKYSTQAYHAGVRLKDFAHTLEDAEAEKVYDGAIKELQRRGYDRYAKEDA